jgi:transposase
VVAVMDSTGKLVMESILETEAATILQFFAGLRGTLSVTFEEGTWSVWLYDLLNPHVDKLVVCNPRKNALLKDGNKSDRIDARKLAELLRGNQLKPVYHGENGVRMLRELSRSYLTIVKDLSRVMNRLKAVYRSWAIPCAGRDVYYRRHRAQWLAKIREAGVRRRAERLYEQLDMLQHLRQQARRELLAESRKHAITAKLRQIPYLGPIRSALAVALIQTPHRFRSKRQLWAYSGLALETRTSAEYRLVARVKFRPRLCAVSGTAIFPPHLCGLLFGDTHSDNAPAFVCSLNSGSGRSPNLPQWASRSLVHGKCHFPQFLLINRLGRAGRDLAQGVLHATGTNS